MKQGLAKLNLLMGDKIIAFDDIKDPGGELYSQLNSCTDTNGVPAYIKKKLVHLVSLEDRCKEEQVLVKGEMGQFFRFMSNQISAITSWKRRLMWIEVCSRFLNRRLLITERKFNY